MTIENLPGQDWTNYLKAKLEDRNPKCGNCKAWVAIYPDCNFGACSKAAQHMPTAVMTPNLSLCTAWEKTDA